MEIAPLSKNKILAVVQFYLKNVAILHPFSLNTATLALQNIEK